MLYSNMYIWNLEKWYSKIYLWGKNRETDIENGLMDMGRGEERVRCMETYITMCKIDSQWEFAVWLREFKQGFCINLEVWDGAGMGGRLKRERIYVYLRLIHVEV